jgi:hypothetical protein
MPISPQTDPLAQDQPVAASTSSTTRREPIDDTVVIGFALFGIMGGVFLPHVEAILPIVQSFMLAMGAAALVYRFLGGINGASFTVGSLKLGGGLAALVGVAMLINHVIVSETPQTYQVQGVVYDDKGDTIPSFGPNDITVSPAAVYQGFDGKFSVTFTPWLGFNDQPQFPTLYISHGPLSDSIDLTPGAKIDTPITRHGTEITINSIHLHIQTGPGPEEALTSASAPGETALLMPTPEKKP